MSMPLLNEVSTQLRQSTVCAIINHLWASLPHATEERLSAFSSVYKEGYLLQEIMATSLALVIKLHSQSTPRVSPVQVIKPTRSRQKITNASVTPSVVTYHSISPSPSDLALPNSMYQYYGALPTDDNDYQLLISSTSYNQIVVLRESLLPFYASSNITVAPQLKKECYNKSKLSMEYRLQFQEVAVIVVDGRVTIAEETIESYDVIPEFLLEQLHISGSLEYVVESRTLSSQTANYIITVRSKQLGAGSPKKLHSNVTSKCLVSLETLATHITLPFLMVFRHTSESLRHMRELFDELKISHILNTEAPLNEASAGVNEMGTAGVPSWNKTQSLVQQFHIMELRYHPQLGKPAGTPLSVHLNASNKSNIDSMHNLLTVMSPSSNNSSQVFNTGDNRNPSLSSYEPPESPIDVAIGIETSNVPDMNNDDTTDSPHVFSSDPDAPIQSSMATYTSKPTLKASPHLSIDKEHSKAPEVPNMREVLIIPDEQLEFSIFGSIKITTIQVSAQIESILLVLEVQGLSGSVDCRQLPPELSLSFTSQPLPSGTHIPLVYKLLPTYLSIASTLRKSFLRVADGSISTR